MQPALLRYYLNAIKLIVTQHTQQERLRYYGNLICNIMFMLTKMTVYISYLVSTHMKGIELSYELLRWWYFVLAALNANYTGSGSFYAINHQSNYFVNEDGILLGYDDTL
jgi:hypothetical protein